MRKVLNTISDFLGKTAARYKAYVERENAKLRAAATANAAAVVQQSMMAEYASEDGTQEVLICIGKNTRAGEYLNSWYQSGASKSKIDGTEMYLCRYKDTSETCYYAVFELNGCELYVESFTADESGFVSMLKAIAAD